jgi:Winged helix-turn-helix DNA-binding
MQKRPPDDQIMEAARRALAARIQRDGRRSEPHFSSAAPPPDEARRQRSLRCCHMPAAPKRRHASPRPSGAYVPELAARIENDRNLTDGARRCGRKLAEYVYRKNRVDREAQITVTYLMRALGKSRRTVQRYLRQLEQEGYIAIDVVRYRTRMCAGLLIRLLAPLFPKHNRQKWPTTSTKSDAPQVSQNDRFRYKSTLVPRQLWAITCTDPIRRAWDRLVGPLPAFPTTV